MSFERLLRDHGPSGPYFCKITRDEGEEDTDGSKYQHGVAGPAGTVVFAKISVYVQPHRNEEKGDRKMNENRVPVSKILTQFQILGLDPASYSLWQLPYIFLIYT